MLRSMAVVVLPSPEVPQALRARASHWADLKRWERREIGQELRRLGLSYREIAAIIPVGKGTLSGWCRDLELTTEQRARLRALRPAETVRMEIGLRRRKHTLRRIDAIKTAARAKAHTLRADPFWVAGVVAYWSEGAKSGSGVRFSNSDPALVRLFISWAHTYLGISRDRLSLALHLHDGQDEDERIRFWSEVAGVLPSQFGKTYFKREGTGHRKKVLYHGTVSVRIRRSGLLLHQLQGWWEALGEIWGSFTQPEVAIIPHL